MSASSAAREHARARTRLAMRLRQEAHRAWSLVDPQNISASWTAQLPRLVLLLTGGQHAAAVTADRYITEALTAQGMSPATQGRVDATRLAGIASDGRPLDSLLVQPGITAKVALAGGHTLDRAMASGDALAQLIAHTQVTDAGRVADQVALTSRPHAAGYVRMVAGGACSRCIVLAGRWYRWNAGFERHPHCSCVGIPAAEDHPGDLATDPRKAFDAMSAAEQDKTFTKDGAEAIRGGANIGKVVNARRGMYTAGGHRFTHEAAGRRPRLMPEQIMADAKNRDDAIQLLKLHGYIV
jgi:hypothetical protein